MFDYNIMDMMTTTEALEQIQDILQHIEQSEQARLGAVYDVLYQVPDLWGCTDRNAANYNRWAKYDDGSCQYYAAIPEE